MFPIDNQKINSIANPTSCLNSLNAYYALSFNSPDEIRKEIFACAIASTLSKNIGILKYAKFNSKKHLYNSLKTHSEKYILNLSSNQSNNQLIEDFKTNLNLLDKELNAKYEEQINEAGDIKHLSTYIVEKCCVLFSDQLDCQKVINNLQATTIACNIYHTATTQLKLVNKLLLVKELWALEKNNLQAINNKLFALHTNLKPILNNLVFKENQDILHAFINLLVDEYEILQHLNNHELLSLYDRIKNLHLIKNDDDFHETIHYLLQRIYSEAQLRYSHNQAKYSSYELVQRFESLDAVLHQIENSEFFIVEAFLISPNLRYINEIYNFLIKHADIIKVVINNDSQEVDQLINKLQLYLKNHAKADHNSNYWLKKLNIARTQLHQNNNINIRSRYSELDDFAKYLLNQRYSQLFKNIESLWQSDDISGKYEFIQKVITNKISKQYPINVSYSSIGKLRALLNERHKITVLLRKIDFYQLFRQHNNHNITSLNFKRQIAELHTKRNRITTVEHYIKAYLQILVTHCNASQLWVIYQAVSQDESDNTYKILKQEMLRQIKQRTTISQMLYSILTGKKAEFNKLQNLKEVSQAQSKNTKDLNNKYPIEENN